MENKSAPKVIPDNVIAQLCVRWLENFQSAARSQNKAVVMKLFAEASLINGAQKGGPMDHVLSKNFHMDLADAKIFPYSPTALVIVAWHSDSEIVGGPTRKGDASFYFVAEVTQEPTATTPIKRRFVAHHAHFSQFQ
jgi:hypothetical protein